MSGKHPSCILLQRIRSTPHKASQLFAELEGMDTSGDQMWKEGARAYLFVE